MLKPKQRSYLKSLANPLKPLVHIGKEGLSDSLLAQLDECLTSHELVKVSVLENSQLSAKEIRFGKSAKKTRSEICSGNWKPVYTLQKES